MGDLDGPNRRISARLPLPDVEMRALAAGAPAKPAAAPWNASFEKIAERTQPYDPALFAARTAPPSCAPRFATADNARTFAERGIPVADALAHSLITSVGDLERFLDEYIAYTAARPQMKSLHDDAARTAPAIFARRLDTELADAQRAAEQRHVDDQVALMQLRPPLVMQQRAAVGEVAIPIARTATDIAKVVPVVGEIVMAAEAVTGKDIGGLGEDLDRSERLLSGALLMAPLALEALGAGVRGAAQLVRVARATGATTEETRSILRATLTLKENEVALRDGLAAQRAGRALTTEQANAFRAANGALRQIRGTAAQSIFDMSSKSGLPVRSFAPNANGVRRSIDEASAIARRYGVEIPPWIRIEVDPTIKETASFAEYRLGSREFGETSMLEWADLAPGSKVVVRIHPNVLASDEKILGVFQHEVWELTELRQRVERRGLISAEEVERSIDGGRNHNLHGQAWDVADLRVLMMRESDPVEKAKLSDRLARTIERYKQENRR